MYGGKKSKKTGKLGRVLQHRIEKRIENKKDVLQLP
jgi:hypothetical protein